MLFLRGYRQDFFIDFTKMTCSFNRKSKTLEPLDHQVISGTTYPSSRARNPRLGNTLIFNQKFESSNIKGLYFRRKTSKKKKKKKKQKTSVRKYLPQIHYSILPILANILNLLVIKFSVAPEKKHFKRKTFFCSSLADN